MATPRVGHAAMTDICGNVMSELMGGVERERETHPKGPELSLLVEIPGAQHRPDAHGEQEVPFREIHLCGRLQL